MKVQTLRTAKLLIIILCFAFWNDNVFGLPTPPSDNQVKKWMQATSVEFTENKGQLADSAGNPLNEVLFRAELPGTILYITEWGLTYYFLKIEKSETNEHYSSMSNAGMEEMDIPKPKTIHWQRVDMELAGANIQRINIEKNQPGQGFYNYYYGHCPDGILNVQEYKHLLIKDVYPGIDWEIIADGKSSQGFKTNFLVATGADYKQIQMKIWGPDGMQTTIADNAMQVETAYGRLEEKAPAAFANGQVLKVQYEQRNGLFGFHVPEYAGNVPLVIDPIQLIWSTFYGGSTMDDDASTSIYSDGSSVWVTGWTYTSDFPTQNPGGGAYFQGSIAGFCNAFILQFNTAGVRQWATYYGGDFEEIGFSIHNDGNSLWVAGCTRSSNFPTQDPGGGAYFQGNFAGGSSDAFILQFNVTTGVRQWSTYYGGDDDDCIYSIHSDGNSVWVTGASHSSNFPTYDPGGGAYFQGSFAGAGDAFILRFNATTAVRQWATFYGGDDYDYGRSIHSDGSSIWVAGGTNSSNFSTYDPGGGAYFQGSIAGPGDAFILQFNAATAVRQWATYYGGNDDDDALSIHSDGVSVWVTGSTSSSNFPTYDPGGGAYFQGSFAGLRDAFILQFNAATAVRQWATYYGGNNYDHGSSIHSDGNSVWVTGGTNSSNFPTYDPGGGAYFQGVNAGWSDAFILQFNTATAVRQWAIYYGGSGSNSGESIHSDGSSVWVTGDPAGFLNFPLLDPGGGAYFQGSVAGSWDMFITQFNYACSMPVASITGTNTICTGDNTVLTASGGGSYQWNTGATTNIINVSPTADSTYSVIVSDSCGSDTAFVTVYVAQQPIATISGNNSICAGNSTTLTASGGGSYLWSTGETTATINISPPGITTYDVTVTNACGSDIASIPVTVYPSPFAYAGEDTTIATGSSVQLNGTGGPGWNWSPSTGLSCTNCQNPTATPPQTTIYTLTIVDGNGCAATDSVTVMIDANCVYFIPNVFSPNGDGNNDVLYVRGAGFTIDKFIVYNRWGEKVFETTDPNQGWDGRFQGKALNPGVFVYYLKATCISGSEINEKGNITLVK